VTALINSLFCSGVLPSHISMVTTGILIYELDFKN
jgi:hypothetical protein